MCASSCPRNRFTLLVALLGAAATPWVAGAGAPAKSTAAFSRNQSATSRSAPPRNEGGLASLMCGSTMISQNADPMSIDIDGTVACTGQVPVYFTFENFVARVFTATSTFELGCVEFGIESNTGGASSVEVSLFGDSIVANPAATLLAQVVVPVANNANQQLFQAMLPSAVLLPAGSLFSVQLRTPNRSPLAGGDGGEIFLGSNSNGQSAPAYIKAASCGVSSYFSFAEIGFPEVHPVMNLGGAAPSDCGSAGGPANDCATSAAPFPFGELLSIDTTGAGSDGPVSPCEISGDVWYIVEIGAEPTLEVAVFAQGDGNPAIAIYNIGPDGIFDSNDLGALLAGCADDQDGGLENADFAVTPGNQYLVQIGSSGSDGVALNGLGGFDNQPGPGDPMDYVTLACLPGPCLGETCRTVSGTEFAILLPLGARFANTCADCLPPTATCPCSDNVANLVAYWPMDSFQSGGLAWITEDFIGSNDLDLPCSFAGGAGCTKRFTPHPGVHGDGIAMDVGYAAMTGGTGIDVGDGHFSVSAWVVRTATASGAIIGTYGTNSWEIGIDSAGKVYFNASASCGSLTGNLTVNSTSTVPLNVWTHVAVAISKYSCNSLCPVGGAAVFYIDGVPAGIVPLTNMHCDLSSSGYQIGAGGMWLDELMLFDAVINAARVLQFHDDAADGFCPYSIWMTPWTECSAPSAKLVICNFGPPDTFTYNLLGLPGVCPTLPWSVKDALGAVTGTVPLNTGDCTTIPLTLTVPACVSNVQGAKWMASVTPSAGTSSKAKFGSVSCSYVTGGGSGGDHNGSPFGFGKGVPQTIDVTLLNSSADAISAAYQIAVYDADDGALDTEIFSLDCFEPGAVLAGDLSLAPGESMTIPVVIESFSVDLLGWYNLVVSVDVDGDGEFEPVTALGLQALLEAPATAIVADLDGDGDVNGSDLGLLLGQWGQCIGCGGCSADFNDDGAVDGADMGVMLGAW